MSLLKKLAGETAIYGGSTILNRLLNYVIVTPYLTRVFDNERQGEYGIHGLMYGYSAVLLVVLTYGMETAFFRFANREQNKEGAFSTAMLSLLATTLLATALLMVFSPQIAALLTRPSDSGYVSLFALIMAFDVLSAVPFARLRLENRPLRFAGLKTINIVVNGLALIFFLEIWPRLSTENSIAGRELWLVFFANLVASAVTLLLFLPDYRRVRLQFDRPLWSRMLAYALPLVVVGVAGMINQVGDRLLLNALLPGTTEEKLQQVGIYTGCTRIAVLMSLFTQAFRYASEPFFFRYADQSDSKQVYARIAQAFALVGSLAFLGTLLYLDLIRYLTDPSYWTGLGVVPILLMGYLFLGLYYNLSVWYKLTDRTQLGGLVSLAGMGVLLGFCFWLIPRYGYMGAAWATLACFGFELVVSYALGQRYYPVPYPLARIGLYLGMAVGSYLLSVWIQQQLTEPSLWLTLLINTGILLVHMGLLILLERRQLRALLPGRR